MLYRLVRPMRRKGSRHPYFLQRIPADVKALAVSERKRGFVGQRFWARATPLIGRVGEGWE